jgi:hypothetical protein
MRLLVWLVVAVLSCFVGAAHAVIPTQDQYVLTGRNNPAPTRAEVCVIEDAYLRSSTKDGYGQDITITEVGYFDEKCYVNFTYPNGWTGQGRATTTYLGKSCPANSAPVEGGCACASGYQESGNACVPEPDECQKLAGQSAGVKTYEGRGDEFFFCDGWNSAGGGKCVVKVEPVLRWEEPRDSGHWLSQGNGRYTGQKATSCTGSGGSGSGDGPAPSTPKTADGEPPNAPDPGTAAPSPCPEGQSAGEVNGQRVCAPRGTDGKVEEKSTSSSTNANGDKTDTTKETKCDGSKCTTTTTDCTTLNGQTSSTCSSTSSTVSASDACKGNSSLSVCGDGEDGSSFSGSCASGFQCKGDAIQCAMAQEQHKQRCDFVNWSSTWKQTGETQVTGVRQGFEQAAGGSQFTAWLNQPSETAACPAGKPMQLLGQSYVLSFDPLCEVGEGARPIVLAVAVLLALRTFMRVVLVG